MKKEMNNKGFSLVELIIVIAIMVILVAVLAPQYLKYVEKSRVSTDVQTTVELINSMQVLASDPDTTLATGGVFTATSTGTSEKILISADLRNALVASGMLTDDDFDSASGAGNSTSEYQSSGYKAAAITLELKYDSTTTTWSVKTTGVDSAGKLP